MSDYQKLNLRTPQAAEYLGLSASTHSLATDYYFEFL